MKKIFLLIVLILLFVSSASAQLLVSPHTKSLQGDLDLIPSLVFTEVDYELDNGGGVDVDRFVLGAAGIYGLSELLDIYLELGLTLQAEIDSSGDDIGYIVGTGLKGLVYRQERFSVVTRGGVRFIDEDYGGGSDGTIIDLELGAVGRYALQKDLVLYGGLDFYPISEGEIEIGGSDIDIERDSLVGFRIGAAYRYKKTSFNGEIGLLGEEGFIIRVKVPL